KWLIQHHGDSVLRLAGIDDIESWTPLQTEEVQPRRIGDGLLEVFRRGRVDASLFLVELATRPEERVRKQLADGAMLVFLDRGRLPEVICFVLSKQARRSVPKGIVVESPDGHTRLRMNWTVVELWKIPAESLLEVGDVGLVPWIPLCDIALLGDPQMIIDSPLLKEILEEVRQESRQEGRQDSILDLLHDRFGPIPAEIVQRIRDIHDEARLQQLLKLANECADFASYEAEPR
ncbi:MAG TPA: DUF4351 domain-containing protein, partial [Planctomycetaceae bacterium]|nr:DUF4351 domain-containing protein [Planctomycetaceae bacterium]